MRLHREALGDDFEDHLSAENKQEDHVEHLDDWVGSLLIRILEGQRDAVGKDNHQDQPIEPAVEYDLHDETAEPISGGAPAQGHIRKVFCLVLLDQLRQLALLHDRLRKLFVVARHLTQRPALVRQLSVATYH